MVQSGFQMCAALDQNQGWTSVIIVGGECKIGHVITGSMMPLFSVKVCAIILCIHNSIVVTHSNTCHEIAGHSIISTPPSTALPQIESCSHTTTHEIAPSSTTMGDIQLLQCSPHRNHLQPLPSSWHHKV